MNEIKPKWFVHEAGRVTRSDPAERAAGKGEVHKDAPPLEFRREGSAVHALYQEAQAQVDRTSAAKISELKEKLAKGQYEPNLRLVAERMLQGA